MVVIQFLFPFNELTSWLATHSSPLPDDPAAFVLVDGQGTPYELDGTYWSDTSMDVDALQYREMLAMFLGAPPAGDGLSIRLLTDAGEAYSFALLDPEVIPNEPFILRDHLALWWASSALGHPPPNYVGDWYNKLPSEIYADPTASAALVATVEALNLRGGLVVELTPTPTPEPFRWDDPETDVKLRSLVDEHLAWLTFPDGPVSSTDFEAGLPYPVLDNVEETTRDGGLPMCDRSGMQAAFERMEAGDWYMRLRDWHVYDWYQPYIGGFDLVIPSPNIDGTVERVGRETGAVQGSFSLLELYLDWQFSFAYLKDGGWHLRTSPLCGWTDRAARR
jgi:hypothetical protein